MEVKEFLRVVKLRKGRVTPAEFTLRPKERGLSLFAHVEEPGPLQILEAVRAAGKQGPLAMAVLTRDDIEALGLMLKKTVGCTPEEDINAIHHEARLPWFTRVRLRLCGIKPYDHFNDHISSQLCSAAHVWNEGERS